jgi:hypothetical protein
MNVRFLVTLAVAGLGLATPAFGMDRWEALAMIESGKNDCAIGSVGEVSRYQIRPEFWPGGNPQNPQVALSVAQKTMQSRLNRFVRRHNRQPNDFEFYVLWNAPYQTGRPSAVVKERAQRFANLVQS